MKLFQRSRVVSWKKRPHMQFCIEYTAAFFSHIFLTFLCARKRPPALPIYFNHAEKQNSKLEYLHTLLKVASAKAIFSYLDRPNWHHSVTDEQLWFDHYGMGG